MSDKPENGLKQELDRRKRINRIKSIIVSFVGIWMLDLSFCVQHFL